MQSERRRQIDALYRAACEQSPEQRGTFVAQICGSDAELRHAVEALLARDARPAEPEAAGLPASGALDIAPGTHFGPYRIDRLLGAGGMGAVFEARDSRLGRTVALKVLRSAEKPANDTAERLFREARAASALNHRNVVTVYDIGVAHDDLPYVVMELVEGQTLDEILAAGALPAPRLLAFALQIADALASAHAKGIVHRDLKPTNIIVTLDDQIKLLDFGLARRTWMPGTGSDTTYVEPALTRAGGIVGTHGYMAPEQARGESVDFRADQFAFGAVLYEMATGRHAFQRATEAESIAAVLHENPEPVSRVSPHVPTPLQWAIERCLAKPPADRYASTRDLRADLAAIADNVHTLTTETIATKHNLPAERTALIGREHELAKIEQLVTTSRTRLVTLTGAGGIGKTRLLIELGRRLLDDFGGGVFFVPLDVVSDPELVAAEIASALQMPQTTDPVERALRAHVRRSFTAPMLLLVDNFEHVLPAAALLNSLLDASEHIRIVVTSRAALHVYGEHEYRVPPLTLGGRKPGSARQPRPPAVELFLARATSLEIDALDDTELAIVTEICERLDGLPLAIELAAGRTKVLPLEALLERVRDPLQLLAGGPRDLPARQRTLRATIEWSYNLLDEGQQKLFRRLGVFVGGATLEALEAVCNVDEDLDVDLIEAVESLVDNSLLRRVDEPQGPSRFTTLETMREYTLGQLAESGEEVRVRRAHAAYCIVLTDELSQLTTDAQRLAHFDCLDREAANLRAALDWLIAAGDAEWGLRLATGLGPYWTARGRTWEGFDRFKSLLALEGAAAETEHRVLALTWTGELALNSGHTSIGLDYHRQTLELARKLGLRYAELRALNALAQGYRNAGELERAMSRNEEAVELARELGSDASLIGGMISNVADLALEQGDYDVAQRLHEETSQLFLDAGSQISYAWSLNRLGDVARERGDFDVARRSYEAASSRFRELGERLAVASNLHDMAELAIGTGDGATAEALDAEALELYWTLGHPRHVPRVLESMARAAVRLGEPARALTLAGAAATMRKAYTLPISEAMQARLDEQLDAARRQLPGADAAASWMSGWAMQLDDAIDFALRRAAE